MPVCIDRSWDMELIVENSRTSEFLEFDIRVVNEVISGFVIKGADRTELSGRCSPVSPSGIPEVSFMDFRFLATGPSGDIEILMAGMGYRDNTSRITFDGFFVAVAPISPTNGVLAIPVGIDEGDTGTGNGNQT